MRTIREQTEQAIDKRKAQDLYSQYMVRALETRTTGDRTLFEDYYQRAKYYLRLMNELSDGLPIKLDRMVKPSQQGKILSSPFGNVLRHNRWDVQRKGIS